MEKNPRLIVALDFSSREEALSFVEQLNPLDCALKIGLEIFTLLGSSFVKLIIKKGFKVFLDLKFHDIPNTVAYACRVCADLGVWMLNVHASGGLAMMEAARKSLIRQNNAQRPLLLAVTVLTSMNTDSLKNVGIVSKPALYATHLAQLTQSAGLDGVICSALEVPSIKKACGQTFLTVTPGIRLSDGEYHDQKRVQTPEQAIQLGSDFLVVGRPITRSPAPQQVIQSILKSFSDLTPPPSFDLDQTQSMT